MKIVGHAGTILGLSINFRYLLLLFTALIVGTKAAFVLHNQYPLLSTAFITNNRIKLVQESSNIGKTTATTVMSKKSLNQVLHSNEPTWCDEQQIYINGTIASSSHAEEHINSILSSIHSKNPDKVEESEGAQHKKQELHIFGYGSLCWNPGSPNEVLANPKVQRKVAKAIGWKRCWCQRSTDHRGDVSFPGLVCTLLSDEEISNIKKLQQKEVECTYNNNDDDDDDDDDDDEGGYQSSPSTTMENKKEFSMTEGVLYTIPPDLVEQCLAELDFREKGGYARDVINVVVEDEEDGISSPSQYQKALLYRGTPDNPAFSKRALLDMTYAASIMAVAVGPSGRNDEYLYNLDTFLSNTSSSSSSTASSPSSTESKEVTSSSTIGDKNTKDLAALTSHLQKSYNLYFLVGAGSNQHDQLLLSSTLHDEEKNFVNAADLVNGEDAHELTDITLIVPKVKGMSNIPSPKSLYAGGGHSAMLTDNDDLYLWGWNDCGQLGRPKSSTTNNEEIEKGLNVINPLAIKVEKAALGQSHTLVIEKTSKKLYCFGDDGRGQVSGTENDANVNAPMIPIFAQNDEFVAIAAGVFHSAAITSKGELVTFGCGKFSQTLQHINKDYSVGRWKPDDGSKLTEVTCGRRHTMALDEHGRIWTMGENKTYGQLGRSIQTFPKSTNEPQLMDSILGTKGSGCEYIDSGWSHSIALVKKDVVLNGQRKLYGWGRCDKFQFGKTENCPSDGKGVDVPHVILKNHSVHNIVKVSCGAESLVILNDKNELFGCGWNEHGNLATGSSNDIPSLSKMNGTKIRKYDNSSVQTIIFTSGGAHFLACCE